MMRLLIYGILAYLAYRVFKIVAGRLYPSDFSGQDGSGGQGGDPNTDLIQDPQCGAFFLKQRGVSASVQGRRVHFCSEKCRDSYLARHRSE